MGSNTNEEIVTRGDRERKSNRFWRLVFWVVVVCVGVYIATNEEAFASDNQLRCGNDLVELKEHRSVFHEKCGEPKAVTPLENDYGANKGTRERFDMGYGKDDRIVRFNSNGYAIRIWEAD